MVPSIEVDFEAYKALTNLRPTEDVSYNDVIRDLLKLPPTSKKQGLPARGACVFKGVVFPEGTQFRATYKGQTYTGEVKGGRWLDSSGQARKSPSHAAGKITGGSVNGWGFWHAKRPGEPGWTPLNKLR